jgi:HPt (histidine-containing phosphotransfer) domain-containing protein
MRYAERIVADAVKEMLAAARSEYAGRLLSKVSDLEALATRAAWSELRMAAHKLRGSAATYGYPSLGAHAAAVEEAVIASGGLPDAAALRRIDEALAAARAEARRAALEEP